MPSRKRRRAASYEDIDEDNFHAFVLPSMGTMTTVTFTDAGAQVDEKTPAALIALAGPGRCWRSRSSSAIGPS